MTGYLMTSDHRAYTLPRLISWNLTYTGSVPCDSFTVTFLYEKVMAEPLHLAAGFSAMENGQVMLRGIVDEYTVSMTDKGLLATVRGRGYAARLLDNEARPVTYQAATLAEIVRCHVEPYGISCREIADVRANSTYTVAAGTSQWRALENFCHAYGGFSPRFNRDGQLLATAELDSGKRLAIHDGTPVISCTLREDHYGVLTEVLVIDKKQNVEYSVKNQDMINRGGQCRRVVYTPGQSTWAAMRYTGEYQIDRSKEEEKRISICLPGNFAVFPGDIVRLNLKRIGIAGEYRTEETENIFSASEGAMEKLQLKEKT
ncbi:hypothetical protein SAMN05216343_10459 [Oscillibacter sp. PC13]|uniref:hypothetical protein n=1 Tax=Oscillibacter sp. PC13 TaxID=1855299 RepID=UPI0008EE1D9B|nr:hypothetical protein [Oscillibacter sp. PC13]SFP19463.1 hypothetical protein SAMN05216343_10459 [Oscillibacter sp. PC13]